MKFNYEGFYSCSVTVIENESEGSALPERYYKEPEFILELNHPYIFEVQRKLWLDGSTAINVPIVIGEIVNPDYKD